MSKKFCNLKYSEIFSRLIYCHVTYWGYFNNNNNNNSKAFVGAFKILNALTA